MVTAQGYWEDEILVQACCLSHRVDEKDGGSDSVSCHSLSLDDDVENTRRSINGHLAFSNIST